MARKNLSRTVIEGGRVGSNKWERRNSSKEDRVRIKQYLHEVVRDVEHAEEIIEPERDKVYKEFKDKLSPMYRWIEAQVGRPWSEVHSEIFKKFDSRTTAGRHILFDHLLSSIVFTESGFNKYGYLVDPDEETLQNRDLNFSYRSAYQDYFVNQKGILCKTKDNRKAYRKLFEYVSGQEYIDTGSWLNGRMIVEKGGILYWCSPNDGIWKCSWIPPEAQYEKFRRYELKYYLFDNGLYVINPNINMYFTDPTIFTGKTHGDHWEHIEQPFSFRQRGPLSEEDAKFFKSLKKRLQREILDFTKGR